MSITLYEHQEKCVEEVRENLRRYNSVLLQAPTGFGKTVVASYMAQNAVKKNKTVWFICHRAELVEQTSKTFLKNDIHHSFIASGRDYFEALPVQICSIQTLKNRVEKLPKPDLVIWDECHHLGAKGWAKVKSMLRNAKHVGLSATPERLDARGLGEFFDVMVRGPSVEWLIENGYLSDYKIYAKPIDINHVHTRFGEFKQDELAEAVDKPTITGDIVDHWLKYAKGKKTICFAVNVEHSKHIVEQFKLRGVSAAHVDGKTDRSLRKAACEDFAHGRIDVLCNVDLFGEGFDIAAQAGIDVTVEAVIQARPTQSLALHRQQVGRALRKKSYFAIILDHAGNSLRHGLPDDEYEWSLDSKKRSGRKSDKEELLKIKQCEKCYHVHKLSPACPECGNVYEVKSREILEEGGKLVELDKGALRKQRKQENRGAKTYEALVELGRQRKYKNPEKWARIMTDYRQGKRIKYAKSGAV